MSGHESRSEVIHVRVTESLKDAVRIEAAKQGYESKAEYVRKVLRDDAGNGGDDDDE